MATTAKSAGLVRCRLCTRLSSVSALGCPGCGEVLEARKPRSLERTAAMLIAAAILYIPANLYPVMTVTYLGDSVPDTIISGVVHLWEAGDIPIALLVFFASIVVPMLKIFALGYLVFAAHRGIGRPRSQIRMFRIVEFVGRWSMLDVFMISILAALLQLGALATIEAGVGATAFAAVVVLTMLAARSFDPRLLWPAPAADRQGAPR